MQNIGEVRNTGFEVRLATAKDIRLGAVDWNSNLSLSVNKDKVLALAPGQTQIISGNNITKIGNSIGELYGYEVIGVSVNDAKSHQKFIEKNELPFTLIADTDKKLVEQFGVWGEKSMYGRKYMGTFRTTFIINEEGVIERIISPKEVKTKEHAQQIL